MVHVNSQKAVKALNDISEVYHVNSLRYSKSLILYWMTLVEHNLIEEFGTYLIHSKVKTASP